jgi:hypothetical protein
VDDQIEAALDIEWASSMAPGASIRVYESTQADTTGSQAFQQIISDLPSQPQMRQISVSYGAIEGALTPSQIQADSQYLATIVASGVTVFFASGDGGSRPDPVTGIYDGSGAAEAVIYPASDPSVTGVGGTSLTYNAYGYIPTSEVVWFNATGSHIGSSGGGASTVFGRPGWQVGEGVPAGAMRLVPDVASSADPNKGAYVVFNGAATGVGGTSWSAPTWAGFCALLSQSRSSAGLGPIGLLNPKIYPLVGSACFHDITIGTNGDYAAGPGYDECTGLGTPNVGSLIRAFSAGVPGYFAPVVTAQPASLTTTEGLNATFSVTSSSFLATSYAWQRMASGSGIWTTLANAGAYSGATAASLVVGNVTLGMSGDQFQCVVSNAAGSVTSAATTLTVVPVVQPVIEAQPSNQSALVGQTAKFSVTVDSPSATTYQWQVQAFGSSTWTNLADSPVYSGVATDALQITGVAGGMAGEQFRCIITDSAGSVTSAGAVLNVSPVAPPALAQVGWVSEVAEGFQLSFGLSLDYSESVTLPTTYQWYHDGVPIQGATQSSYLPGAAGYPDGGEYLLAATNAGGTVPVVQGTIIVTNPAYANSWLDAQVQGTVAYFLYSSPAQILRYDMGAGAWLPPVSLSATPTAFRPTAEGVYVAFGLTTSLYSLDLSTATALPGTQVATTSIFVNGSYAYLIGSNPEEESIITTLARSSGLFVCTSVCAYPSNLQQEDVSSELGTMYGEAVGSGGAMGTFTLNSDGTVTAGISPFADMGLSPPASKVTVFPGGMLVASNGGAVFNAANLSLEGSLGPAFDDLCFLPDGNPVVVRGNVVSLCNARSLNEIGRVALSDGAQRVFSNGSTVVLVKPP